MADAPPIQSEITRLRKESRYSLMAELAGTYAATLECENCMWDFDGQPFAVPKGVPAWEFAQGRRCSECGCDTLVGRGAYFMEATNG